ncbi:MAG: glycoside hydrolase family 127 protein [Thermoguttaceae bacterium]|nr:glycoside hydrolase family 127 protein [Thermoguttaceae bacterium]
MSKKIIVLLCAALLWPLLACAQEKTAPAPVYERLPLGSVTARGWLRQQLLRSKDGMGGHLDELEPEMIGKPYIDREHQSPVSPGWSGEISGTYWTGLVQLAFTLDDPELKEKARRWVEGTIALQEEDGYLGSYRPTDNRLEDYCAWSANWGYRALLAWAQATGDERTLEAVHRGLLWFVEHWAGDQKTPYAGPVLIESMIDVWRQTGDERLAQWPAEYLDWLDQNDPFCHGRRSLLREELNFNDDHVVAFGENMKNPALVWLYSGDPEDRAAAENGIRQAMSKCWLPNGAPSSNGEHFSPPSSNHETEYCNFATWQNSFLRMLAITGEAKYGDWVEKMFFNAAQGARKKDERAMVYDSMPNQFQATITSDAFQWADYGCYAPNFHVACCPAQSVRLVPEYIRSMVLRDREGNFAFPVYGPCRMKWTDGGGREIAVEEETNYPFDGKVTFTVKAGDDWPGALVLRIPQWADSFTASRTIGGNTRAVETDPEEGWLCVSGPWGEGERLEIIFTDTPRVVETEDIYFQKEPLRVVEYGPLLFSFDQPTEWEEIPGHPLTPLPEGWSWWNATSRPIFYSLTKEALAPGAITVNHKDTADGYPWENPPLTLSVPMIRTQKYAWPFESNAIHVTPLPYGNPVRPDEGAEVEQIELVPYGATNLRLTCFPIAE